MKPTGTHADPSQLACVAGVNGVGERKRPQPPPPRPFFARVLAPLPRLRLLRRLLVNPNTIQ